MDVADDANTSIPDTKRIEPRKHRYKPHINIEADNNGVEDLKIEPFLDSINAHNINDAFFWKIQAVFYVGHKFHVLVAHKDLNENQYDIFEDERIGDAAMRGNKIPSSDEHWKLLYKRELRTIQSLFIGNIWVSEMAPEKNRGIKLIWGIFNTSKTPIDSDSQIFFLQRNNKQKTRIHTKKTGIDANAVFG